MPEYELSDEKTTKVEESAKDWKAKTLQKCNDIRWTRARAKSFFAKSVAREGSNMRRKLRHQKIWPTRHPPSVRPAPVRAAFLQ